MTGFLGTGATRWADLNLVAQLAMGLALLVGWRLARRGRFRAHARCQAAVVLLNLILIALVMAPVFRRQVWPNLAAFRDPYYALAAAHAAMGVLAEVLGLYVLLVAGTRLVPERLRFVRYKPWMRATLAIWWLVVLGGVGTYGLWYLAPGVKGSARAGAPAGASAGPAGRAVVTTTNYDFAPKTITVPAGTTVRWAVDSGRHTVEADDGAFKSATLSPGEGFEHRFERPGTFPYFCEVHGDRGGKEMAGVVVVTPRP
jgi:plastocyanin/uncharacterized membrane protein YozB (DUF420 family)